MIPIRDDQPRFSTPYVTYFLVGLNLVIKGGGTLVPPGKEGLASLTGDWAPQTIRKSVASASKPSDARSLVEPTSHALARSRGSLCS